MSAALLVTILAYVAVSHPETYKKTSGLLGSWVASSDGLPKIGGLFLHAIVFILLAGLLLTFLMPRKSGFAVSAFGQTLTVGTQPAKETPTPTAQ
jgi:hypothetical protein